LRLTHQPQVSLEDGAVHGLALRLIRSAGVERTGPGPGAQGASRTLRTPAPAPRGVERADDRLPEAPTPRAPGAGRADPALVRAVPPPPPAADRPPGPGRALPPVRLPAVRSSLPGSRGPSPRGPEAAVGRAEPSPRENPTRSAGGTRPGPRGRPENPVRRPGSILLDLAAAGAAERLRRGHDLPVTVPVGPDPLLSATVSAETVAAILSRHALPPRNLTLSLTDAVPLLDDPEYRLCLGRLRAVGVGIALPGLGDGAVHPAVLRRLPVTELHLGRGLVAGLPSSSRARTTATALLALGGELGVTVVADGVDRPEQAAVLRSLGCPRGQGASLGGPLDEVALVAALRAGAVTDGPPGHGPADADVRDVRLREAPAP
ncbi:EAL domain-containing protein, partial [Streptomyces bohaiensis]|uniref:EAL domain-containing protein n=1 Tax=Streptomyces bohaiensis TaxID=1431344 RepID=UPI0030C70927